jgi:hypothetical protein
LVRFLPVFGPFFALFPSMSCAYLYVNNYFSAPLAWKLHSLQRRDRGERRERRESGERRNCTAFTAEARRTQRTAGMGERRNSENGTAFNAAGHGRGRSPAREIAEGD